LLLRAEVQDHSVGFEKSLKFQKTKCFYKNMLDFANRRSAGI